MKSTECYLHHTDHTVKYISVRVFGWLQMKSSYLQCLYRFSEVLTSPDGCNEMKLVKQVHKHTVLYNRERRSSTMQLLNMYSLV